jgi:hypothetical protein
MTYEANATPGQNPPADPCNPPQDPNHPGNPIQSCPPLDPGPKTPKIPDLPKCPEACCCPPKPGSAGTCFDDLIDQQAKQIAEAARAASFKAELEALLAKAKSAKQEYTKEKYNELRGKWDKQDAAIAELIANLVCAVPCWWCLIECEICPLLYAIRDTELKLNGDWTLTDKVYSLYDLRYWQDRNRLAKQQVFDRIKLVLAAWEKPAQTLDTIIANDATLIEDTKKVLATDPASAVYSVFMKLVPMHLAIAPPGVTSKILEYTKFCGCDVGKPDICCGLDVGKRTVRQILIGPQPYIVDPDKFFDIVCCLAKERYLPAKDLLATAESDLTKTESDIKRAESDLVQKKGSLATDFKAGVISPIDCEKYKKVHPAPPPA